MNTYAVDFETYYDSDCSITTLGPKGYFSHPDFDAYMVTVVGDNGFEYVGDPKEFDWSMLDGQLVLSHNASFDESLYLHGVQNNWWAGCTPAEWHCTADMTAFLGLPRSLKNAAAAVFGMEVNKTTRDNMKGKRWESMTAEFKEEVSKYALDDSRIALQLWQKLSTDWPEVERNISTLNRRIGQRGLPIDAGLLKKNLETIHTELFEAEQSIPWIEEYTPLSRKAFMEQCRKQGIEPPTSIAIGNEDADKWFAAHQQACPWARAVQKYRRVNAFLRKLEAFDAGTMPDGRYYGGLMYCGANPTARFSGSGGNLNLQNLPRDEMFGVNFRHLIRPKDGHKLIVADLSQIEVRTLCYLANDVRALNLIRESEDIYHAFGVLLGLHDPANGQLKTFDPKLRQKIKAIVLGCFEPDTLVLTESGWKPILYLNHDDRVWDGVEWVSHQGVICHGIQPTIRNYGVGATADHEILTEHGWREWQEVATNPTLLKSATALVTLPCLNGSTKIKHGIQESGVSADGRVLWTGTTSSLAEHDDAILAQNKNQPELAAPETDTRHLFPTTRPDNVCSTESPPASVGATTQMIPDTITTGVVGLKSTNLGERTGESFLSISPDSPDGIIESFNSTESTTTRATNQTTSGLSHEAKTCTTDEPCDSYNSESRSLKRKSFVYDVRFAGPRNRFTILTDAGPMIVHNCGYGMGPNKFSAFSNMPLEDAVEAVNLYRERMQSVKKLWRSLDEQMSIAYSIGQPFELELPSSRQMRYGQLKRMREATTGKFRYLGKLVRNGQMRDFALWGGILTENLSQGLARDIFSDMMLRIDKTGIPIILHVHDEVVMEVPEETAERDLQTVLSIMSTPPDWIPDIPVAAEGHILDLYSK